MKRRRKTTHLLRRGRKLWVLLSLLLCLALPLENIGGIGLVSASEDASSEGDDASLAGVVTMADTEDETEDAADTAGDETASGDDAADEAAEDAADTADTDTGTDDTAADAGTDSTDGTDADAAGSTTDGTTDTAADADGSDTDAGTGDTAADAAAEDEADALGDEELSEEELLEEELVTEEALEDALYTDETNGISITRETGEDGETWYVINFTKDWVTWTNIQTALSDSNVGMIETISGSKGLAKGNYKFAAGEGCTGCVKIDSCINVYKAVTIDLNGCQLWIEDSTYRANGAFNIYSNSSGGTYDGDLTIIDSSGEYVENTTSEAVSGTEYGNESSLTSETNNDGYTVYTLTYYVTKSTAGSNGTTSETLYKYTRTMTYTSKGGIYSNNSNRDSSYEGSAYGNVQRLIYVKGGDLTLKGGTYANYSGCQGIYVDSQSGTSAIGSVTIDGAIIAETSSTNLDWKSNGKAIYISGNTFTQSGVTQYARASLTMTSGAILNNKFDKIGSAAGEYSGGAIYATNTNVTISGGTIAGNKANKGGGIYLDNGTLNLSGSTVLAGNYASYCGGGIFLNRSTRMDTIANISGDVVISGNAALDQPAYSNMSDAGGGGIYVGASATTYNGSPYVATLNISGGYITNNFVDNATASSDSNNSGKNGSIGGGGIYIASASTTTSNSSLTQVTVDSTTGYYAYGVLKLSGGYITGNYAKESGGGIYAAGTLTMTGGTVAANVAGMTSSEVSGSSDSSASLYGAEGGGIRIQAGSVSSRITGGYITNNTTNTQVDWGGGGIFVSDYSSLEVDNVIITDNEASGYGGGLAACPTGGAYIKGLSGALIYGNTAGGTSFSAKSDSYNSSANTSTNAYDVDNILSSSTSTAYFGTVTTSDGSSVDIANAADYFTPLQSYVSGTALGGGSQEWVGGLVELGYDGESTTTYSAGDQTVVEIGAGEIYETTDDALGLVADPSEETIRAAQSAATVYISGNTSATNGGGIMVNGELELGGEWTAVVSPGAQISAEKAYVDGDGNTLDLSDDAFTFLVLSDIGSDGTWDEDDIVTTVTNDSDGLIDLLVENFYIRDVANSQASTTGTMTYTYYLVEKTDDDAEVTTWDDVVYKITFTVNKTSQTGYLSDGTTEVTYYLYSVTNVKIGQGTKGSSTYTTLSDGIGYDASTSSTTYTIGSNSVSLTGAVIDLAYSGATFTNVYGDPTPEEEESEAEETTPTPDEEEETTAEEEEETTAEEKEETTAEEEEDEEETTAEEEDDEEETTAEDEDTDDSLADTGDSVHIGSYLVLLLAAAAVLIGAEWYRRKRRA